MCKEFTLGSRLPRIDQLNIHLCYVTIINDGFLSSDLLSVISNTGKFMAFNLQILPCFLNVSNDQSSDHLFT
jgi:hypothetical protein